jgi:hypothetical protein
MTYSEYVEKLNERVYRVSFLGKTFPKGFRWFLYDVIGACYRSEFYDQLCEDVRNNSETLEPFLSRLANENISIVSGEKHGVWVAVRKT